MSTYHTPGVGPFQNGKVRWIGYSGDNEAVAWAAARPEVAVIQTSINICDQANIGLALSVAREHNWGVLAKRPVANAAWKDIATQPGIYQGYARTYTQRLRQMNLTPSALGFAGDPMHLAGVRATFHVEPTRRAHGYRWDNRSSERGSQHGGG